MKNKSKQLKQGPTERNINLDLNWEKLADMEASLRKIINSPVSLPFSHESIQLLLKFTKQILKAIETMKSQQKHFREIQQSYNMIQSKLSNHENIVNNLEQQHMQRYKSLSDQIKNSKEYYEKAKKNLQQSEQQSKLQYQAMKKENQQMKYKMDMLTKQKQQLILQLKSKELQVKALQQHKQRFVKVTTLFAESQPKYNQPNLASILCSSIAHRITAYLSPLDITNLQLINKQCRIYLKKSKSVQNSLNKSIIQTKNRTIAYYHKHIDYFEKLYHKIPQQILQTTFYRYQILKQSIGTQILNVLNSSAMLFEGKFQDIDDDQMKEKREDEHEGTKSKGTSIAGLNIDIQKQIKNLKEFNNQNPSNVLEIDEDIIRQFLQDHKSSREKLTKQISSMYSKIKTTAQIYSVDVQSIGKFITNILINFSKVFVLSKNLYAEARNLQSLNTLILRQLANWDKIQVQKNSQIEDLKAQLQAERKLKIFFTNQSIKSQQRALAQENVKLGMEYKFSKQVEKLDSIFRQKQQLKAKLAECQKDLSNLKSDNREIRRAYQSGKQKYNKILEQLSVVKETILRMNIV